MNVADMNKIS